MIGDSTVTRASCGKRSIVAAAISWERGPDMRTIARAPLPAGVAMATMVSENSKGLDNARSARRQLERFSGLDDADGRAQMVIDESLAKTGDGVVRRRGDVAERAPMIRDQDPRAKALEQRLRVFVGEMAFAEPGLPPRRIADREQGEIELAVLRPQRAFDQAVCVLHQRRVAGKEDRLVGIEQVHVRVGAPAIVPVAIAPMGRRRGVNGDVLEMGALPRAEIDRVVG